MKEEGNDHKILKKAQLVRVIQNCDMINEGTTNIRREVNI